MSHSLTTTAAPLSKLLPMQALHLPAVQSDADDLSNRATVWWCLQRRHLLPPRDRRFLAGLTVSHNQLSPNQQKRLQDIVAKLQRVEAA